MSVINNALAELANKKQGQTSPLTKAEIPPVRHSYKLAWALGGCALSLCLGGWAVSQPPETATQTNQSLTVVANGQQPASAEPPAIDSPTQKVIAAPEVTVYSEEAPTAQPVKQTVNHQLVNHQTSSRRTPVAKKNKPLAAEQVAQSNQTGPVEGAQVAAAQVATAPKAPATAEPVVSEGTMEIRQVELTPGQLAQKAVQRAEKALDANNLDEAIEAYELALKYQPGNETNRKKLAALYYGKKDPRSAADVLQRGIKRDKDSQALRLALSKLLSKENQPEAALSPLVYLPDHPQLDYLAMRAALAQQNKMVDIALETYQMLVTREADNARWWLGLAIQQERKMRYAEARTSYQNALEHIGVSKKTQIFIRDRLALLATLEEQPHAKN